jgi:c-di-GMP-binding flagellar brake protein YcgR
MNTARNKYLSDDHEDFTVSGRESILGILRELADRNITLSGVFNGGVDVLLTAVLDVDHRAGKVYLDANANEERNEQFRRSERVIFVAQSNGAKIQWVCNLIESVVFEGNKAFLVQIPEKLQRVQRRNSFRVTTPITNPVMCRLPVAPDRELLLPLVDISVEGVGVILPSHPEPAIEKNATFKNCRLEHENLAIAGLTLSVQSTWEVTLENGTQRKQAGFGFIGIPLNTEAAIQRFVHRLERIKIATTRGDD